MKYLKLYESYKKEYSIQDWIDEIGEKEIVRGQTKKGNKPIEDLYSLTYLYCHKSPRKLTTLKGIEKFTKLKSIACQSQKLKDLKGLEYCTKLDDLCCWDNKLTDLKEIRNLTKIDTLFCHNNPLGTLKDLKNLINIKFLECHHNDLNNLEGTENLKKLALLECNDNNLENLDGFENFINLETLYISNNLLKNLNGVEKMPKLNMISCNHNPWETLLLPNEIVEKYNITYIKTEIEKFSTYDFQKEFLTKYPKRAIDLISIKGVKIDKRIIKEFPSVRSLLTGKEWGFFDLKGEQE